MTILLLLMFVIGFAVFGNLAMPERMNGKPIPLVNWLGSSVGALVPVLALNCLIPLHFAIDPIFLLVQECLLAGIAGGCVDIPMMLYRNKIAQFPVRQTVRDGALLVALVGILVVVFLCFRANYVPNKLPI